MKKIFGILLMLFVTTIVITSCKGKKVVVDDIEKETEKVTDDFHKDESESSTKETKEERIDEGSKSKADTEHKKESESKEESASESESTRKDVRKIVHTKEYANGDREEIITEETITQSEWNKLHNQITKLFQSIEHHKTEASNYRYIANNLQLEINFKNSKIDSLSSRIKEIEKKQKTEKIVDALKIPSGVYVFVSIISLVLIIIFFIKKKLL